MYQKIKAYVKQHHMLEKEDRVIVGVSGGADSVCLLFVLLKLREEWGIEVMAVHIHHGIRGESADADEAYVRRLCDEWKVPLVVFRKDVKAYAVAEGMTEEEAGREVRRAAFCQVLKEKNGTKIALAHHMNDNAETILFHMCRGTDMKGMGGIAPVSGKWIRPLLCLERQEIESYLEKRGISYCTDETNNEDIYARNKIRKHILPCMESINDKAVEHISGMAAQMRLLWEYIGQEVEEKKKLCIQRKENAQPVLLKEEYQKLPEVLRTYVIHDILCETAGRAKDIESVHVRRIEELMDRQVGRQMDLPYGITARRCYEGIRFSCIDTEVEKVQENVFGEICAEEFRFRMIELQGDIGTFPENPYTKWFDYDIIKNTVETRHREPGDYLTIDRNGSRQKLKQYFINEKIPQEERDQIWLVADGHHIMWVVGYRQNQQYQVTDNTRRILEVQFCGGEKWQRV